MHMAGRADQTSGLTNYVVGLDIVEPAGREWSLAPQFGDLKFAEAGFVTELGKFSAKWQRHDTWVSLEWNVPVRNEREHYYSYAAGSG